MKPRKPIRERIAYTNIDGFYVRACRRGASITLGVYHGDSCLGVAKMTFGPEKAAVPNFPYEILEEAVLNGYKGNANYNAHERGKPRPFPYRPGDDELPREPRVRRRKK